MAWAARASSAQTGPQARTRATTHGAAPTMMRKLLCALAVLNVMLKRRLKHSAGAPSSCTVSAAPPPLLPPPPRPAGGRGGGSRSLAGIRSCVHMNNPTASGAGGDKASRSDFRQAQPVPPLSAACCFA